MYMIFTHLTKLLLHVLVYPHVYPQLCYMRFTCALHINHKSHFNYTMFATFKNTVTSWATWGYMGHNETFTEIFTQTLFPLLCSTYQEICIWFAWWRHEMETFSALLAICAENSVVPGEFPAQRPVTRSFDVFFDLRLNKRLSKLSWVWWFETPSWLLWRHRNGFESSYK